MNMQNLLQELLEISIQLGDLTAAVEDLQSFNNQSSILLDALTKDMSNLEKGR